MSALVRKEIRLLLPAWITAMLLVIAPILLGRLIDDNLPTGVTNMLTMLGVAIGCVVLGLAVIGREIASHTFTLLLAQPRPRGEYWRVKLGVLIASLIPVALFLSLVSRRFVPPGDRWDMALIWFLTACVAVTGGLWTTLLFRQIIASFWISVLHPFALFVVAIQVDDERTRSTLATVLLLAYSVAGYLFAHWQFRHAQDTAWTGGDVSLPSGARWLLSERTATAHRKTHPLRALLGKEFQFQHINFLLAGLVLVVQVVVHLLQKFVTLTEHSALEMIVQNFWVIWIVMPLLVGCSAVAEERRLGTLEPQLCLPVARAWQFAVKVVVTLVCGLVLGALVPVVLTVLNPSRGATGLEFAASWTLACGCLALVSFYASSLTHQLLQALGTAVGIMVVGLVLVVLFVSSSRGGYFSLFGTVLWQGPLVIIVGATVMLLFAMVLTWRWLRWVWVSLLGLVALALFRGTIQSSIAEGLSTETHNIGVNSLPGTGPWVAVLCPVVLTLALAAKNFKHSQISLSLWWRNSRTWLGCLVLTGVITTLIYNRVWEFAMQFEPPAGVTRLSGPIQPVIAGTFHDRATVVLLPDGRLCSYRGYEIVPPPFPRTNSSQTADSEPTWRTIKNPPVEFVGGSNWVAVATTRREIAGVKSDGSLWSARFFDQVDEAGNAVPLRTGGLPQKGLKLRATELKFEPFGAESGWAMVAGSWSHFVALKRDGTIWGWGNNENKQLGDGPTFITNAPVQIGVTTNWVAVYAGAGHSYSVKYDGEIWKWGKFETLADPKHRKVEEGPVKLNIKVPGVRSVVDGQNNLDLIVDTNGNLWGLGRIPPAFGGEGGGKFYSDPMLLGGTNWFSVSCNWQALVGLKDDGTIWIQRGHDFYNWPLPKLAQLGKRTDWIAVKSDWEADLALAKDGTICRFGDQTFSRRRELLAPTRRATWSLNLLDAGN